MKELRIIVYDIVALFWAWKPHRRFVFLNNQRSFQIKTMTIVIIVLIKQGA